jgi:multiple sugar transport system substrate-binding protein
MGWEISTDEEQQRWEQHKARFQEKYPQVTIEEIRTNLFWEKLPVMVASGTPPDIARLRRQAEFPALAPRDAVLDLTPYLAKSTVLKKTDFYESAVEMNSVGGKLYSLPDTVTLYGLFYNKNLFDEQGLRHPDLTWDYDTDWLQAALKLTRREGDRIVQAGAMMPSWWIIHYAGAKGVGMWEGGLTQPGKCSKVSYGSPGVIQAYQWYQDMFCKHRIGVFEDQATQEGLLFESGRVAMQFRHYTVSTYSDQIKDSFAWDWLPAPLGEKGKPRIQTMIGGGQSIFTQSQVQDVAWAYMEFSEDPAYLLETVRAQGARTMYANRKVQESKEYVGSTLPPTDKKVILEGLKAGRFFPEVSWEMRALNVQAPTLPEGLGFGQATTCGGDVKQILPALEAAYNGALKAQGVQVCG